MLTDFTDFVCWIGCRQTCPGLLAAKFNRVGVGVEQHAAASRRRAQHDDTPRGVECRAWATIAMIISGGVNGFEGGERPEMWVLTTTPTA